MDNLTAPEKPFLKVSDLADLLDVNEATIYLMNKEKRIPGGARVGRQIRFDRGKVQHWLESGGEKAAA